MKSKILLLLTFISLSFNTFSQSNFRRWSVGLHPGITIDNMDFRYDRPRLVLIINLLEAFFEHRVYS